MRRLYLVVFSSVLTFASAGPAETLTLPRDHRPGWLSEEGLVMAGSWEPLPFRVRRDGSPGFTPTAEQQAAYEREHSPELTERGDQQFVHLINYRGADPVNDIEVRLRIPDDRRVRDVVLASPERERDLPVTHASEGGFVTFVVPQLDVYEVAVISIE